MNLDAFSRFSLTTTPTPLQRASRLEAALGPGSPRIFIKRDDLTGLAFGGNKARKLEYLVADALAQGATILVTEGATQSNHARMTAAAALLAGMKSFLILDARHGAEIQGNLLLDHLMGAEIRVVPTYPERKAAMGTIGDELRARGERPYLIPAGGSVPIGALGYVAMIRELMVQLDEIGERPTRLYFPTGSQGTHAGIAVGARAFAAPFQVIGIAVESNSADLSEGAARLASATADLLGLPESFASDDLNVDDRFVGPDYGVRTEDGLAAIHLLARTEAVFLDPVYTGKAMAGVISHVRSGAIPAHESIVFVHTGGGPSIFAHAEALSETADNR